MSKTFLSPSKPVSAGSFIILILLLFFGIGFAVIVGNVLSENDVPSIIRVFFFLFIIMWIGGVVFMLIYHAKNYNSEKGISLIDINSETGIENKGIQNTPSERLRDLELLKKDGLITEKEYEEKRAQILGERW